MPVPPRPHLLARSPNVDRVNGWLEKAWARGMAPHPSLDPDALWAAARKQAPHGEERGVRDEADVADFRLRLSLLAEAAASEAQLNPLGLTMAHAQLVRAIRHRLELGALWQRRPELLGGSVAPPIIVVGQMRSGTTRVHRLLASDPRFVATRFCDCWNPVPRRPDTRALWSAVTLRMANWLNPWLDTIHPMKATQPDEELGWLASALNHAAYEAQWHVPSYVAFSQARDPAPVYREFARILATDARFHGNASRPRVMKAPQFSEDLTTLLATFPGARVVRTRRDESAVAGSMTSLMANQMAVQSDHCDLARIKAAVAAKLALRKERLEASLAAFDGPMAEVEFAALDTQWLAEIRRIYQLLGIALNAPAIRAMERLQSVQRHGSHNQHAGHYAGLAKV